MLSNERIIRISRKDFLEKFIQRLYEQENVQKICDGDDMLIPISKMEDWAHDMGIILGLSIQDLLDL